MANRQNQYYYAAGNRPSGQNPPQAQRPLPPPRPPQPPQPQGQDPRGPYGQPAPASHGSYTAYGQLNQTSSSYAQPQSPGPRPQPPYPTYPYDDPPPSVTGTAHQQRQYQYHPSSAPVQSSYNPQHYAQTAMSPTYSPPQSFGPPVPPRPHATQRPQAYNPAAYAPSPNPQTSVAGAAHQRYGPVNGNQSQPQAPYTGYSYSPASPQAPNSAGYPIDLAAEDPRHSPYFPAHVKEPYTASTQMPSNYTTQQYAGSANMPSHQFPATLPQLPRRESGDGHVSPTNSRPTYSPPVQAQHYSPSTQRPPQPDHRLEPFPTQHAAYEQHTAAQTSEEEPNWSRYGQNYIGTSGRHPQSRPLPGPPEIEPDAAPTYTSLSDHVYEYYGDELDQDQLYEELEHVVGAYGSPSLDDAHFSASESVSHVHGDSQSHNWSTSTGPNGLRASVDSSQRFSYGDYTDDSDAEAAAGLQAMTIAAEEEERAEERRRQSQGVGQNNANTDHHQGEHQDADDFGSDEEGYPQYDISSLGGGIDVSLSYGGDPSSLMTAPPRDDPTKLQAQHPSTSSKGSMVRSVDGHPVRSSSHTSLTDYSGHSSLAATAHVDQPGTGGLSDPSVYWRKMSFDDSSENISVDEQAAAGADMSAGPPDLPYAASLSMNRPLPPTPQHLPEAEDYTSPSSSVYSSHSPSMLDTTPDQSGAAQQTRTVSPYVPRSTSLVSQPSTPRPIEPLRAKTDGRRHALKLSTYNVDLPPDGFGIQTPAHMGLDIPSLPPGRRFHPSKLSQKDFDSCREPWAMSHISSWLRAMAEGESELREHAILDGLVALFTNKVPNMNITIAEGLAANVVAQLFAAGVLVHEEEWLKFGQGTTSGVLIQLTGAGCYAPFLHSKEISGRCYAPHCQTMVKKISLADQRTSQSADWATFYNISKADVEQVSKTEIELQNNLHEIVTSEDAYMDQLHVLCTLYRDGLKTANPPIISHTRLPDFLKDVFGKLDAVREANEEHLLPQLKYRQQEQGPWVIGFSDIFRHWIRKAKTAYIEYASNFPNANFLFKREEGSNSMFRTFVEGARSNKLSNRLEWSSFLRAPITRLQRYSLLLATAQKHMPLENVAELSSLQLALEEIRAVTRECDAKVAESGKKTDLQELEGRLVLRPEMKGVELNLLQHGRKILHRGDLQRTGGSRFTLLQTHGLLLDNYLVLAKTVVAKDSNSGPQYDISKMPIPMDLLFLESANDDPVEKSYKGVSSVTTAATNEPRTGKGNGSTGTQSNLSHTATSASLSTIDSSSTGKSMVPTTVIAEGGSGGDSKILYPFRIKHLGREMYTLYASSAESRKTWCDKIIDAKTEHAASLYAQNAEPFKLRVVADSAFSYDTWGGGPKTVMIQGSPLARAVNEVEKMYDHKGRPGPVCRARVNCATTFVQPYGTQMIAVGTDYGVYISERASPRGWSRAIPVPKVTQVAVLEEFNLFLLISDKALIAYHLDVICPPSGVAANSDSVRKAPQKLSGARDVAFFVTAKMKERTLIFYKKGSMSSTFKILEPILQRAPDKKARSFLNRGNTMSFRDYDDFYIPTECTALDVFTSTLAVATSKGLEILNLEKKTPFSVPDLKAPHVATIASRLAGVAPLAMFRLNELEFLCVYEECAVYVNKHGDISRSVVMEFVGKAKAAAMEGGYLVLFDQDFIEIRNAQAGSLKQVIAGRDIRCLDNARSAGIGVTAEGVGMARSIKVALQHPEQERTQVVVELILDETRRL